MAQRRFGAPERQSLTSRSVKSAPSTIPPRGEGLRMLRPHPLYIHNSRDDPHPGQKISTICWRPRAPLPPESPESLRGVRGGLRMYLIDRAPLACLSEFHALDGESGIGGLAAQICSTSPCPVATRCGLSGRAPSAGFSPLELLTPGLTQKRKKTGLFRRKHIKISLRLPKHGSGPKPPLQASP
jgi:hypothetical protein